MRRRLLGRLHSRSGWIGLLTVVFAAVIVLPEAVGASGLTRPHAANSPPAGLDARRAIVVRPNRLDLVRDGRVTASTPFNGSNATLAGLSSAVPDGSYVTRVGSTVTLKAALVQRPGTRLSAGTDGVHAVRIVSRPGSTAYLWGTGASLTLTGVKVWAAARTPTAVRPFLLYTGSSDVSVTNSTFQRLGRVSARRAALELGNQSRATVTNTTFTRSATGLTARSTAGVVLRKVTVTGSAGDGISLRNAGAVDVVGVTVTRNARNGLAVSGAATRVRTLRGISAIGNGHAGLMVGAGAAGAVTDVRTSGDRNAGVALTGAGRVWVSRVTSTSEPTGVRIQDGQQATISDVRATDDGTGISADGKGYGLSLQRAVIHGARVGVRVQTPGARITDLQVLESDIGVESGAAARGLVVSGLDATARTPGTGTGLVSGGPTARLSRIHISGHRTGLRIEAPGATVTDGIVGAESSGVLLTGSASGTTLTDVSAYGADEGLRVTGAAGQARIVDSTLGGQTGMRVAAGAVTVTHSGIHGAQDGVRMTAREGSLTLDDVQVTASARTALELDAGTTSVSGSLLDARGTTIDAGAPLTVDSSSIAGTVGLHVGAGVTTAVTDTQIHAQNVGVLAVPGAKVTLTGSRVYGGVPLRGPATLRGQSFIAAMPLNWLGVAGIGLVIVAVLLMITARLRERGPDRVALAPAHVVNRA